MDPSTFPTLRVEACGANGFDSGGSTDDDTCSWKAAIYCVKQFWTVNRNFGTVEGTTGAKYRIGDTISVNSVQGGKIDGNGSTLEWTGSGDVNSAPNALLSLEDTLGLTVSNLEISVGTDNTNRYLGTAIRLTNPGGSSDMPASRNVIDHVIIDGNLSGTTNQINYGVVFDSDTTSDAIDCTATDKNRQCDNDQSVIRDSRIANVNNAAIDIRGRNSYRHLIDHVHGDGPHGVTPNSAVFVHTDFGSFTSIACVANNFGEAYRIETNFEPITIIDHTSEGCGRFITNPAPNSAQTSGHGVEVIGGRVSVESLEPVGHHLVDWNTFANLQITGLFIGGSLPTGVSNPKLINYAPSFSTSNSVSRSLLRLNGLLVFLNNADSSSWDPVSVGDYGRIESSGNACKYISPPDLFTKECTGLLGGIKLNDIHTFSDLSAIPTGSYLADGQSTYCSDCTAHTSPCTGSGTGATATRVNGTWDCSGGVMLSSAFPTTTCSNKFARSINSSGILSCDPVGGSDFSTQSANAILVGPVTGSAATPSFRTLVDADIPNSITIDNATAAGSLAGGGVTVAQAQANTIDYPQSRHSTGCAPAGTSSTTLACIYAFGPTVSGTATNQPALSGASRDYIQYATAASSGSVGGILGPFTLTRPGFRPKLVTWVRVDATDNRRIWAGLSESSLQSLAPSISSAATSIDYVGLAYDSAVSSDWLCCSGDGTNHSCSDTGVSVSATEYALTVDWSASGTLTCRVMPQGGSITTTNKTSNLSTSAVNLGPYDALTTLTGSARNHQIAFFAVEQN